MSQPTTTMEVCCSSGSPDHSAVSHDPVARLRLVFRGFGNEFPPVDQGSQAQYYRYLVGRIVFPFTARYHVAADGGQDRVHSVTVLELLDPAKNASRDGLLCRAMKGAELLTVPLAELEVPPHSPNYYLIEDYWYWFWNAGMTEH